MDNLINFILPNIVPEGFEYLEYILQALINITIFSLAFKTIMYFFTNVFNIDRFIK